MKQFVTIFIIRAIEYYLSLSALFEEVAKYKDHNLNQSALNQIDNIRALSANFSIENKVFRYFPAQYEGKFYWENSTEITHINDLFLDDLKQVGTTNFTLSGYYTDTLDNKVDIKAFLDTNVQSIEIWESNPRNMETDDLLTDEEFILDGSLIAGIDQSPYSQGYLAAILARQYIDWGLMPYAQILTGPAIVDSSNIEKVKAGAAVKRR